MQEVDINTLLEDYGGLIDDIPDNISIVGEIPILYIYHKYDKLDLSKIKCTSIYYYNQEGESIKNHILPNSLQQLYCSHNKLISLPNLPKSLKELDCQFNKLTSFPDLPNSLKELSCSHNQLTSLPDLPNSLKKLFCDGNSLKYLHNLNKLKSISINCLIDYIDYEPNYQETNILFYCYDDDDDHVWKKSYIEIKDYGKITSNEEYIQYMEKIKLSKIKSARK